MSVIVMVNVGTRDVRENNNILKPARNEGKRVLNTYDDVKETLTFPILLPPLEHILSETKQIDRLIFFGTDQEDSTYQALDTIHFAQIAKRFISEQYGDRIEDIMAVPIQGINPALYDEALDFFSDKLPQLNLSPKNATSVYLLPTAGTPACSLALLLEGITMFGDRCKVLYQNQIDQNNKHGTLPMVSQIKKAFQKQTAIHLLNQFNFYGAEQILAEARMLNPLVDNLLQYAIARLGFEFSIAERHLNEAIAYGRGKNRTTLKNIRAEFTDLSSQRPEALLGELYHNARIAWENGRLLDFLVRWFRFQQAALALAVDKMPSSTFLTPVNKEKLDIVEVRQMTIVQMVRAVQYQSAYELSAPQREELSKTMQASYSLAELNGLCFDLGINYENIAGETLENKVINLIQYCGRHGLLFVLIQNNQHKRSRSNWSSFETSESESTLSQLVLALERLETLRPLYEQSVLTAGFGGVTELAIEQAYSQSSVPKGPDTLPLQDMATVCRALAINTENPFRQIRDVIVEKLQG